MNLLGDLKFAARNFQGGVTSGI